MRFCHVLAFGLALPFFVVPVFAQSTQQPASAAPFATTQQTAPAAPAVAPLQLHDLAPEPHTPTPEEQAEQKAAKIRMELTNLARAQASWGPRESASGMSLELKETGRVKTAAATEITYQLTGKGFTPDMQLTLLRWPLNQNITPIVSGIVVNAGGTAVCGIPAPGPAAPTDAAAPNAMHAPSCTKTMKAGTPITITTTVAKGEAVRVALVAADRKHGAAASVVPFPIEGQNNGCKIQVILGARDADLVLVEGSGFKKDATYTLGTESWNQKHPLDVSITPEGHFIAALTPWIPGHDTGDTVVYYQSSTCTPTVDFHWGKDSYKPE
jgi:hypothetical protein